MIVVANLKAYMTYKDILKYKDNIPNNVIVCPSNLHIPFFLNHKYKVGIQDISIYDTGAHTGEICASQVKELGVEYAIIGHSERRSKETDDEINKKVLKALENNLKVILCIGENKDENKNEKIEYQILNDLKNVSNLDNVIIAYEPVWCIGTGITPTNEQIEETIKFIQSIFQKSFTTSAKILYGGSVDKNNINTLKKINLSGFLIGKASTDYEHLKEIVDSLSWRFFSTKLAKFRSRFILTTII